MLIETSETHWVYRDGRPVYRHTDAKVAGKRVDEERVHYPTATIKLVRERHEISHMAEYAGRDIDNMPMKRRKRA